MITLNNTVATSVFRDGVVDSNWVTDRSSNTLRISTTSGEHTFEISTVATVNRPPVLDPIGTRTITAGKTLAFKINATDPDRNTLTYSVTSLPTNATFSAATRSFAWTPLSSQAGTHNITFSVSDGSLKDTETVKITVAR
jgi:hypothetical protein